MTVRERSERHIAGLAREAFKNHTVDLRHLSPCHKYGTWRCGTDSSMYHFRVTIIPGSLFLCGDLGSLVVERAVDMIQWCRGSVNSTGYFAEKVTREMPVSQYSTEAVEEFIDQCHEDEDLDDEAAEILDDLRFNLPDLGEQEAIGKLVEAGVWDWCDGSFNDWSPRFLWQREAVKWFVEHVEWPLATAGSPTNNAPRKGT